MKTLCTVFRARILGILLLVRKSSPKRRFGLCSTSFWALHTFVAIAMLLCFSVSFQFLTFHDVFFGGKKFNLRNGASDVSPPFYGAVCLDCFDCGSIVGVFRMFFHSDDFYRVIRLVTFWTFNFSILSVMDWLAY
eukprot:GABV01013949.1.p1 GENE.GABV01013949.1~~GABV01013949.1.p1  ORF type:complete len:135 (-),score=36.81 GABV01013949.1:11-415(-)